MFFCYGLRSTEETLESYPFPFMLFITYRLTDRELSVTWFVRNEGKDEMHFQIGAHPASAECNVQEWIRRLSITYVSMSNVCAVMGSIPFSSRNIHGFARNMEFTPVECGEDSVVLGLRSTTAVHNVCIYVKRMRGNGKHTILIKNHRMRLFRFHTTFFQRNEIRHSDSVSAFFLLSLC